jgi:hypothetical protein
MCASNAALVDVDPAKERNRKCANVFGSSSVTETNNTKADGR